MNDENEKAADSAASPPPAAPGVASSKPLCGIVMPLAEWDGCTKSHWSEVLRIIREAVEGVGFDSKMVSDADEVGVIHKRIVQNLAQNPVVVCDISGLNPNVMLELGIRLTFDKATVIVKDDATKSPFDMSIIEYLPYPRDLRYARIVEFKALLATKVKATHDAALSDPKYSTFLKHFGTFTVPMIETREGSEKDVLLEEVRDIKRLLLKPDATPVIVPAPSQARALALNGATQFARLFLPTRKNARLPTSGPEIERVLMHTVLSLYPILEPLSDAELEQLVRAPLREFAEREAQEKKET